MQLSKSSVSETSFGPRERGNFPSAFFLLSLVPNFTELHRSFHQQGRTDRTQLDYWNLHTHYVFVSSKLSRETDFVSVLFASVRTTCVNIFPHPLCIKHRLSCDSAELEKFLQSPERVLVRPQVDAATGLRASNSATNFTMGCTSAIAKTATFFIKMDTAAPHEHNECDMKYIQRNLEITSPMANSNLREIIILVECEMVEMIETNEQFFTEMFFKDLNNIWSVEKLLSHIHSLCNNQMTRSLKITKFKNSSYALLPSLQRNLSTLITFKDAKKKKKLHDLYSIAFPPGRNEVLIESPAGGENGPPPYYNYNAVQELSLELTQNPFALSPRFAPRRALPINQSDKGIDDSTDGARRLINLNNPISVLKYEKFCGAYIRERFDASTTKI
ncbi:hypothetical protein WN51_12336 [Melipona quadrifasciata]|uniref:Uncharacterized protein n=1 Tax=Melipona quadrifasciata TaxID=166423 RepID=A0A0M9A3U9_9HYME|nr:hypothetical protein WN51_12336 [Melipona quadrifasciata]